MDSGTIPPEQLSFTIYWHFTIGSDTGGGNVDRSCYALVVEVDKVGVISTNIEPSIQYRSSGRDVAGLATAEPILTVWCWKSQQMQSQRS